MPNMTHNFTNLDYQTELDLLSRLGPRLTGSETQNELVHHLETRLKNMGYDVHADEFSFQCMQPLTSPPSLNGGWRVNRCFLSLSLQ